MEAAGFLHHEKILVGNIANGERFETYCIPADHGSGEIGLNGAATQGETRRSSRHYDIYKSQPGGSSSLGTKTCHSK